MNEKIYTIPVNEAFEASEADPKCGCPFCTIYRKLEQNELTSILGGAMMESDIRIKTNEAGFCREHFDKLLAAKNRLSLALILESHLDEVQKAVVGSKAADLLKGKGTSAIAAAEKLEKSCYICGKIDFFIGKMFETAVWLWETEREFRARTDRQPYFCLPHYKTFLTVGKNKLPKKVYGDFYDAVSAVEERYMKTLCEDVSWFCKKFDYRYTEEPWYNAKDAVERAAAFLGGKTTDK